MHFFPQKKLTTFF